MLLYDRDLRTIKDREPRTANTTFTQLLSSASFLTTELATKQDAESIHALNPIALFET